MQTLQNFCKVVFILFVLILIRSCPNLNQFFFVPVMMLPKYSITIFAILLVLCCSCKQTIKQKGQNFAKLNKVGTHTAHHVTKGTQWCSG